MRDICQQENIAPDQVVLHSRRPRAHDAGATLQSLGVMPVRCVGRGEKGNNYSEALFKTLKYRPDYSNRAFEDLFAAPCGGHVRALVQP